MTPQAPRGKRADVLRGAQAVFSERGFAAATMDVIAARAGVSKRTVYNHFASKDELLEVIVAEFLDSDDRRHPPVYTDARAVRADLRRFAEVEMHLIDDPERRGLSRLLTTTFLHDPASGARIRGLHSPRAAFEKWLADARRDGSLVFESTHLTTRVFYGLVEGCLTWNALMSDGASLRDAGPVLDELIEVFLARYAPATQDS